jgi:tRNA (guanine37-N1)-methyltransferase
MSVHTKHGQGAHRALSERGWLDISKKPAVVGSRLLLPLMPEAPEVPDIGLPYEIVAMDFEVRDRKPAGLRQAPGLPPDIADEVTRSMDLVGDIAILRLRDEHMSRATQIGQALLFVQPRLRAVAVDRGVKGELRVRDLTLVAGEGPLSTLHKEHGLVLRVDLAEVYFSPRLATEHQRVAGLVKRGERFLDMFCGVGPFAISAAKAGNTREVHAVDLNERAVELARENAERNGVGHLVTLHSGDAREVVPRLGRFDRIVMNHPHGAKDFLDVAMRAARDEATIHLHIIARADEVDDVTEMAYETAEATGHGSARMSNLRDVRTYAPGVGHYCMDIVVVD